MEGRRDPQGAAQTLLSGGEGSAHRGFMDVLGTVARRGGNAALSIAATCTLTNSDLTASFVRSELMNVSLQEDEGRSYGIATVLVSLLGRCSLRVAAGPVSCTRSPAGACSKCV